MKQMGNCANKNPLTSELQLRGTEQRALLVAQMLGPLLFLKLRPMTAPLGGGVDVCLLVVF